MEKQIRLYEVLAEQKMTQSEFVKRLSERLEKEVTPQYINKLCKGRSICSLQRLAVFAEILEVPTYTLVGDYPGQKQGQ
jgi:transcriptional regulator with XRE-family HTH domain